MSLILAIRARQKASRRSVLPFIPDVVEEQVINPADRGQITYHDVGQFSTAKYPSYTTLERPKEKRAEHMYTRPGMDNVPSY
uniref:Uncharacterized protein n=1 Tax=Panagrolaimus sp. ES5 TaxID=591445 RepID=A0AC34GZN3_9BILA